MKWNGDATIRSQAMLEGGTIGNRPYIEPLQLERGSCGPSAPMEAEEIYRRRRITAGWIAAMVALALVIYGLVLGPSTDAGNKTRAAHLETHAGHRTTTVPETSNSHFPVNNPSAAAMKGDSRPTTSEQILSNEDIAHPKIEMRDHHWNMGVEIPDWAMRLCTDVPPFRPWFCLPTEYNVEEIVEVPEWALKTCDLPPMEPFWCSNYQKEEAGDVLRLMPILNECGDTAVFHDSAACHKPGGKRDIEQIAQGGVEKHSASALTGEGPFICAPGVEGCQWDGAYGVRTQVRDTKDFPPSPGVAPDAVSSEK